MRWPWAISAGNMNMSVIAVTMPAANVGVAAMCSNCPLVIASAGYPAIAKWILGHELTERLVARMHRGADDLVLATIRPWRANEERLSGFQFLIHLRDMSIGCENIGPDRRRRGAAQRISVGIFSHDEIRGLQKRVAHRLADA